MTSVRRRADPLGLTHRDTMPALMPGTAGPVGPRRRFGGKGGASAPEPDKNIGRAAIMQARTGADWLNFAREQFGVANQRQDVLDDITQRIGQQQIATQDNALAWSQQDRDRYTGTFLPMQDAFLREVQTYDSPERQAQAAAMARADVQGSLAAQQQANIRQAASMGVNPASGRYAGIDRATALQGALAAAGAENTARQQVQDRGLALRADAINIGNGLPAQSASAAGLGLNAGNSVLAGRQAANQQFLQSTDIMNAGFGGAMQGYAGMGNTLNTLYGNQIQAWQAEQAANSSGISGLFSGIGTVLGAGLSQGGFLRGLSSRRLKTDKRQVRRGAALAALRGLPVQQWRYKPGVADGGTAPHIGTYAEDFRRQTGVGDGMTIPIVDAIGLTMAAVKDLDAKVDRRLRERKTS